MAAEAGLGAGPEMVGLAPSGPIGIAPMGMPGNRGMLIELTTWCTFGGVYPMAGRLPALCESHDSMMCTLDGCPQSHASITQGMHIVKTNAAQLLSVLATRARLLGGAGLQRATKTAANEVH